MTCWRRFRLPPEPFAGVARGGGGRRRRGSRLSAWRRGEPFETGAQRCRYLARPAIFAVNSDFSETLRNSRREGEYIVVDGTATQFTLRDGDQWICIFNLRKPDFGAPDPAILGPVEDDHAKRRRRSGN